jgi:enoyl-CoA hydratase/carnithine racemase
MDYQFLLCEVRERVAFVTVNRPDKLNALNDAVMKELATIVAEITNRDNVAASNDMPEGMNAFLEKREPAFSGK